MNQGKMFFVLLVFIASVALHGADTELSNAQSKPHSYPQPLGSVHGRVFAITRGGDLKPARLAQVYLVFETRIVGHKVDPSATNEENAGMVFLNKHTEQMKQLLDELQEKSKDDSISSDAFKTISCKAELLAVDNPIRN